VTSRPAQLKTMIAAMVPPSTVTAEAGVGTIANNGSQKTTTRIVSRTESMRYAASRCPYGANATPGAGPGGVAGASHG
jgi:hypothetical protein